MKLAIVFTLGIMLLSSCTAQPVAVLSTQQELDTNTPTTPCHGDILPAGSCPNSAVLDEDGSACHHRINCGSL